MRKTAAYLAGEKIALMDSPYERLHRGAVDKGWVDPGAKERVYRTMTNSGKGVLLGSVLGAVVGGLAHKPGMGGGRLATMLDAANVGALGGGLAGGAHGAVTGRGM